MRPARLEEEEIDPRRHKLMPYSDRCAACDKFTDRTRFLCKKPYPCKEHFGLPFFHNLRLCHFCEAAWVEVAKGVSETDIKRFSNKLANVNSEREKEIQEHERKQTQWYRFWEAVIVLILSLASRVTKREPPPLPVTFNHEPYGWQKGELSESKQIQR